jgi:signal transduction histidine kinase
MEGKPYATQHAPAQRAEKRVLRQQAELLADQSFLIDALNAVSTLVVVLNKERQIVFGNKAFLTLLEKDNLEDITGQRVGEVMLCIRANETEGGCGTTEFCRMCGAVNSMLSSQMGITDVQECRIIREKENNAFDLRVMASPFSINGEEFTVFSIVDIADEKRKDVLERIFMHDLLNTAGGLRGISRLLTTASEDDLTRYALIVNKLSERLVDEIEAHKQLMKAENRELVAQSAPVNTLELLEGVRDTYMTHELASERTILVDPQALEHVFSSDSTLLTRVLGNMTKNALEAISPDQTVTLSCRKIDANIRFTVHNPGEIHKDTRLQIFQRSFSTKGIGRGLGTYSIKLLSEQYLRGKVGLTSSLEEGTVFYAEYPDSL